MPSAGQNAHDKGDGRREEKNTGNDQRKPGLFNRIKHINGRIWSKISHQPKNASPCAASMRNTGQLTFEDTLKCGLAFDLLDKDRDGKLNVTDITEGMHSINLPFTTDEATEAINKYDLNGDRAIDFQEFLTIMQRNACRLSEDDELEAAFQILDRNGDCFVDVDDLRSGMKSLGVPVTVKEARAMIEMGDSDKDGKLNFKEFIAVWLAIKKKFVCRK